jgi:hypothetical protein
MQKQDSHNMSFIVGFIVSSSISGISLYFAITQGIQQFPKINTGYNFINSLIPRHLATSDEVLRNILENTHGDKWYSTTRLINKLCAKHFTALPQEQITPEIQKFLDIYSEDTPTLNHQMYNANLISQFGILIGIISFFIAFSFICLTIKQHIPSKNLEKLKGHPKENKCNEIENDNL